MKIFDSSKFLVIAIISLIMGIFIIGAVILSILAYSSSIEQSNKAEESAETATKQSYESCVRSRFLSPILASVYEKNKFLTSSQLEFYRATIPKECHK